MFVLPTKLLQFLSLFMLSSEHPELFPLSFDVRVRLGFKMPMNMLITFEIVIDRVVFKI